MNDFVNNNHEHLFPLSKIKGKGVPSTNSTLPAHDSRQQAFHILMEAQLYWDAMSKFRKDRDRNKRYAYGDQWSDIICVDGKHITEEQYIKQQGSVPLKNNHIHKLVKQFMGVYRSQLKEPTCVARDRDEQQLGEVMTTTLQYNMQLNQMNEIHARTMEDFLIGGLAVHRKWFGWRNDILDCWTDYVNPNCFFIDNNMRDFRGWDCQMLGEIHDVSFETLCERYAHSAAEVEGLRNIYALSHDTRVLANYGQQFGYSRNDFDFLVTDDPTRCRVIEVWRRESKPRYRCHDYNRGDVFKIDAEDLQSEVLNVNERRRLLAQQHGMNPEDVPYITYEWFMDSCWCYYFLTPYGDILDSGETPYAHKSHPYVFKGYPFIDGEIHSFVHDIIDQQRYVNRLITLYDWIMRSSAKGVLMYPEGCEPDGMSMEEIADEWSRFNGVVFYKPKPGVPMPTQIANNCTQIGITELLNLQLKFFEDISGINGALQGKPGHSGTSAAKYSQETQNATLSLLDLLESYSSFVKDGAYKDVKNIQQFYDSKRTMNIVGRSSRSIVYNPDNIKNVMFDLSIEESVTTPAYRNMANDFLMQLWQAQAISVEQLLQFGNFPFADELLQNIKSQQEQIQQGQTPDGLSPQLLQQVKDSADMKAVNAAQNAISQ